MGRKEMRGSGRTASVEISRPLDAKDAPLVEGFAHQVKSEDERYLGDMNGLLETPFYSLNYSIPQFRQERVSPDPRHWGVKWFFPNAEEGPLYVDYPRGKADLEICLKKAKIMERLNLNYRLYRPEEEFKLARAMDTTEADAEIPHGEAF